MLRLLLSFFFSLPLFSGGCYVGLDIGHSPGQQGAVSARGVGEYAFNRAMAISIYNALHHRGIEAFFLNADEKPIPLKARVSAAKSYGADLLLSIHHDSVQKQLLSSWQYHGERHVYCDRYSGYSLFVSKKNMHFQKSLMLAREIGLHLGLAGFSYSRHHHADISGERRQLLDSASGVSRFDNLVVLKYPTVPAVLIECGVILNREEELRVKSDRYRHLFSESIAAAVEVYCGQAR